MNTLYDVRQLLKKFGTFIYIGDRLADLELMELELSELYQMKFIPIDTYKTAILIIRKEKNMIKKKEG